MANLLAKIDLLKLKNAYISSDRNNGEVIVIPIQKNNVFVNKEKGTAWLSLTAWHNPQEFCTHTLFAGKKSEGGQLVGNLQTWEQANPNQRNQQQQYHQQPNRQQYQPTPQPRQDFSNHFDRDKDPDLPF